MQFVNIEMHFIIQTFYRFINLYGKESFCLEVIIF